MPPQPAGTPQVYSEEGHAILFQKRLDRRCIPCSIGQGKYDS